MDRRVRSTFAVKLHQRAEVERRQHVSVADDKGLVRVGQREAQRTRGVERLRLDGIPELHPAVAVVRKLTAEVVRQVSEGQHDLGHAMSAEPIELAFDQWL